MARIYTPNGKTPVVKKNIIFITSKTRRHWWQFWKSKQSVFTWDGVEQNFLKRGEE